VLKYEQIYLWPCMRCQVPGRSYRRWTFRFRSGWVSPCCHCCCINKCCWHTRYFFILPSVNAIDSRQGLSFTCPACHANATPLLWVMGVGGVWLIFNYMADRPAPRKTMHATGAPRQSVLHLFAFAGKLC